MADLHLPPEQRCSEDQHLDSTQKNLHKPGSFLLKRSLLWVNVGLSPLPVRVTTRIITFLVGNPYKPSFPLLLGGGTTQGKWTPSNPLRFFLGFGVFGDEFERNLAEVF